MKVLVTGASGFVGKKLALKLLEMNYEVVALARKPMNDLKEKGAKCFSLNLTENFLDRSDVFEGVDAIMHVAAKVDMWGEYVDFFAVNVQATRNLLSVCKKYGIKRFVYTSSPSVIANGKNLNGVDESIPYPKKYKAFYPMTKAQAEKEVLEANTENLKTISLRPHLIFGPGDQNFLPTILERADAGRLVQVGSGKNICDFTFIDDCVDAHIKALFALDTNSSACGRAYFISQGEPWPLWKWINTSLHLHGRPEVKKRVPFFLASLLALIFEKTYRVFRLKAEPFLTTFLVSEMATSHYFNIAASQQELGFIPQIGMQEALELTAKSIVT